ncbi:MAG: putative RNA uridine N3 methyltransferase, partial [Gluconacetobacter sp.]
AGEVLELAGETDGLPLNVRVTVDMAEKKVVGVQEAWGPYTGYVVRLAASVEDVFTEVNTALVGEAGYDMSLVARTSDFFARTKKKTPALATLPAVAAHVTAPRAHPAPVSPDLPHNVDRHAAVSVAHATRPVLPPAAASEPRYASARPVRPLPVAVAAWRPAAPPKPYEEARGYGRGSSLGFSRSGALPPPVPVSN